MEEEWIVSRSQLRELWFEHPEWSQKKMADGVGRSKGWVKKWLPRLRHAPLEDREELMGRTRARKRPPPSIPSTVVQKILDIRDHPPTQLGRIPGPVAILYYLKQETTLREAGIALPRSTCTIWKVLDQHDRILRPSPSSCEPEERPAPGVEWGMDFHDVSTVPADPQGKQQHVVEVLNFVDHGSSVVVDAKPGDDYNAESALRAVAQVFLEQGCPDRVRLDRDPRWVGSWTAKDFPSPTLRFLLCLGIEPRICPPQRPDKNPSVERYNRNFKYECQLIEKPGDLPSTIESKDRYVRFYNFERPNQAITCGNQPPRVKFPDRPSLSPVPETIEPDRWLSTLTGKTYKRKLDAKGCFQLGSQTYYVQQKRRGQIIVIWVDGQKHALNIFASGTLSKSIPIKGLQNRMMKFQEYLDLICKEAVSVWRQAQHRTTRYGGGPRCR